MTLDSASGNPYQPTLLYHGFEASPLQGTPQGVAVYVNGVRFNQPFGDTVNWDLIPDIAIDRMNLEGSNPVFGLNALGGSLNVQLKNGFTYQGAEADVSGGSFGQVQGQFQYGKQSGNESAYIAGTVLHQDGWRDLQSSDIHNVYGDIGWRGDKAEVHLGITAADTRVERSRHVAGGTAGRRPRAPSSPRRTASPTATCRSACPARTMSPTRRRCRRSPITPISCSASPTAMRRTTRHATTDRACCARKRGGSAPPAAACQSRIPSGGPIPNWTTRPPTPTATARRVQVTNTDEVFGLKNHLVGGISFDGAQTEFDGVSSIGGLTPVTRVFVGPGMVIDEPGSNRPVRVGISNAYSGVFATDTLELTPKLAVTLSGRFNAAQIDLNDQNGGDLTGNHCYDRFNPAAGATYKVTPWLTAYAGYSEANRAPTPAELSCASPRNPAAWPISSSATRI